MRTLAVSLALASAALSAPAIAGTFQAMELNNVGGDTGYVRVADDPGLEPATFTLEAWVTPLGAPFGGNDEIGAAIIGKPIEGVGGSFLASWWLGWSGVNQSIVFSATNSPPGAGAVVYSPNGSAPLLSTFHVAATFDGALLTIYIDGVEEASAPYPYVGLYYGDEDVLLGAANYGFGFTRRFTGVLDEVRIWDHARSETEIDELYLCRLTGNEAGLLAYWTFDGSSLSDHTTNGHDGVFQELGGVFVDEPSGLPPDCAVPTKGATWGQVKATFAR